jgi:hypothetical protein
LNSTSITESIFVPDSEFLGHIVLDLSHYVYITDWSAQKLFRININDQTSTTLYNFNSMPVGISYEENNNRLIILTLIDNAPIIAYNLNDGNIYTVRNTNINDPDAICTDFNGNYYITSFTDNIVYRFGNDFSSEPDIISTGHCGPSGIGYNMYDNIISVTNYNFNSINLIQLEPSDVKAEIDVELIDYVLFQNHPNPFNPATWITYNLFKETQVILKIYDLQGREVRTLVSEKQSAGLKSVVWDGRDKSGKQVSFAVYIYIINAGLFERSKKMILI